MAASGAGVAVGAHQLDAVEAEDFPVAVRME